MSALTRRGFIGQVVGASALLARAEVGPVFRTSGDARERGLAPSEVVWRVEALLALAALRLDEDDSAAWAELFTADATLQHGAEAPAAEEKMADWHARWRAARRKAGALYRFQCLSPVVEGEGAEVARVWAPCTADGLVLASGLIQIERGLLCAELKKSAAGWRLCRWTVGFTVQHPSTTPTWLTNGKEALQAAGHWPVAAVKP